VGSNPRPAGDNRYQTESVSDATPDTTTRLLVGPARLGERLDVFIAGASRLSRRAARKLIANGLVRRNGEVLRVQSRTMELGDVVDVLLPPSELGVPAIPEIETPNILFEDCSLLVAEKPAGVLSQPAEDQPHDELSFDLQVLLALANREGRRPFLRLVHRLDRVTSGAVLFAREPKALPSITRLWSSGQVERLYLAVVEGHPTSDSFEIDRPIARDRKHRWRFHCHDDGKTARTRVVVVARLEGGLSIVRCRLLSGRTHQVRVHLMEIGFPVLGDWLYGSRRAAEVSRPMLHAASLALPHPITGDPLHVICPLPKEIGRYVPADLDPLA
jgi:23S rRNA pseudouridine1911/1915/1917 synthase